MSARVVISPPVLNRTHPLAKGMVFYAPLFERGGTVARDIVSGQQGTITPGTGGWIKDLRGTSYNFDAAATIITYANTPATAIFNGPISIAYWSYPKDLSANYGVFQKRAANNNNELSIYHNFGKPAFNIGFSTTPLIARANAVETAAQWQQWVFTFNGLSTASDVGIYRNGITVTHGLNTNGVGSIGNPTGNIIIGQNQNVGAFWKGYLADFMIWKKVLTSNEAALLYRDTKIPGKNKLLYEASYPIISQLFRPSIDLRTWNQPINQPLNESSEMIGY